MPSQTDFYVPELQNFWDTFGKKHWGKIIQFLKRYYNGNVTTHTSTNIYIQHNTAKGPQTYMYMWKVGEGEILQF